MILPGLSIIYIPYSNKRFPPVAGYERLRLQADQGDGRFGGATRVLTFELVTHVQGMGRQNLISTRPSAAAFDAPIENVPSSHHHLPSARRQGDCVSKG